MFAFLSHRILCRVPILAFSLLVTIPVASAQTIEGNIYYYTDTATINTDISGNDVVVGKAPGGLFGNAEGDSDILAPYTVTITKPATITSFGNSGYSGLEAFNNTSVAITGGNITSVSAHNNSAVAVSGGNISGLTAYDNAILNLSGQSGVASAYNHSIINLAGSTGSMYMHDTSILNVAPQSTLPFIEAHNSSTVNYAGKQATTAFSFNTSVTNITGGTIENVVAFNSGRLNITGGTVHVFVNGWDTSTTTMSGGSAGFMIASNTSSFFIKGGNINYLESDNTSQTRVNAGTLNFVVGADNSHTTIHGGIVNAVSGLGNGHITIAGGTIQDVFGKGNSAFLLSGGTISASTIYQLDDTSFFRFVGQSLDFSNPVAGVYQSRSTTYNGVYYDVAWTQLDGTVDNTRYFDVNGDINNPIPQGIGFQLTPAPEPDSLSLVALAVLVVAGVPIASKFKDGIPLAP